MTQMTRKSVIAQVCDVTITGMSLFRHTKQKSVRDAILCNYN